MTLTFRKDAHGRYYCDTCSEKKGKSNIVVFPGFELAVAKNHEYVPQKEAAVLDACTGIAL